MNLARRQTNIAVVGMADHGKTTWIRQHLHTTGRLIVVDTLGDHTMGKKGQAPWLPLPNVSDSLPDILRELETIARNHGGEWQFGVPLPVNETEQKLWFDFLCREAYQIAERYGTTTLVVEEAGYFTNPNFTPDGLNLIIQYGAHPPVNLVWTARNLSEVSRRLTSETDVYVLFCVHEPRWLDAISERLTDEIREIVSNLAPGECISVDRMSNIIAKEELW